MSRPLHILGPLEIDFEKSVLKSRVSGAELLLGPRAADVMVFRDGEEAVAVDSRGRVIAGSRDHAEVIWRAFSGGGRVYLDGEFKISKIIPMVSDLEVLGSPNTVLRGSDLSIEVFKATTPVENVKIRGIKIENAFRGIYFNAVGCKKIVIEDVEFHNVKDEIRFYVTETEGDFEDITVRNVRSYVDDPNVDVGGSVEVTGAVGFIVEDIFVYDANGYRDGPEVSVDMSRKGVVKTVLGYGHLDYLVRIQDSRDVEVDHVISVNSKSWGSLLIKAKDRACERVTAKHILQVDNQGGHSLQIAAQAYYLKDVILEGFIVDGGGSYGISVWADQGDVLGVKLLNGIVKNCGKNTSLSSWLRCGILVNGRNNKVIEIEIKNVRAYDDQETKTQQYGIVLMAREDYGRPCTIRGIVELNDVRDNAVSGILAEAQGSGVLDVVIRRNLGFPTENSGVATLPAGSTSVTVNHGLAKAPRIILLTPAGNANVWYENVTDTSFDIVTDTAPSTDLDVAWYAEV